MICVDDVLLVALFRGEHFAGSGCAGGCVRTVCCRACCRRPPVRRSHRSRSTSARSRPTTRRSSRSPTTRRRLGDGRAVVRGRQFAFTVTDIELCVPVHQPAGKPMRGHDPVQRPVASARHVLRHARRAAHQRRRFHRGDGHGRRHGSRERSRHHAPVRASEPARLVPVADRRDPDLDASTDDHGVAGYHVLEFDGCSWTTVTVRPGARSRSRVSTPASSHRMPWSPTTRPATCRARARRWTSPRRCRHPRPRTSRRSRRSTRSRLRGTRRATTIRRSSTASSA